MNAFKLIGIMFVFCIAVVGYSTSAQEKTGRENGASRSPREDRSVKTKPTKTELEKHHYQNEANRIIKDMDNKIERLGRRIKREGSKLSEEARQSWRDLKSRKTEVKKKTRELKEAGEPTWRKIKLETNKALDELKSAYEKTLSYFRDKRGS